MGSQPERVDRALAGYFEIAVRLLGRAVQVVSLPVYADEARQGLDGLSGWMLSMSVVGSAA
jgi:hypothetical protein